jgi:hypothetical protein
MADKVYQLFIKEMEKAKSEHETMTKNTSENLDAKLLIPIGSARMSCLAIWTKSIVARVEKQKKTMMKLTGFIK